MQTHSQKQWFSLFLIGLTSIIITLSAPAFAKGDVFVTSSGTAIKGYDPVAYFVSNQAQKGNKQFSHVHEGNTWLFANAANKKAFIANPTAYIPQYGGHCAYAASKNSIAPVDPRAWSVINNKLYLNYNKSIHKKWLPKSSANIIKGDKNWKRLAKEVKQDNFY